MAARKLRALHRHYLGTQLRDAKREISLDREALPQASSVLLAAQLLGITLTSRAKGEERVPMAGVPHHAAKGYVARLVAAGRTPGVTRLI